MGIATNSASSIHVLLRRVIETGASDLHMAAGAPPALRINGRLAPESAQALTAETLDSALREVASGAQREAFSQEQELDFAYSVAGVGRFRVNAAYQRGSVTLAFRPIRTEIPSLEELGLPAVCASLVLRPRGLVLVTGPTGSGKSTTLAAMIDFLNARRDQHIITVEDPIEFVHQHKRCLVSQREVGSDTGSFAAALKHALRQDPDVILVGEMRDLETVALALTAAETGHLVLATLHTPSAAQTIDRVIDSFPPHQQQQVRVQLSMVLEGVLCQTLVPRVDGLGRAAALEIMIATPALRNLIREGKTHQIPNVIQTGGQQGMQTLEQALAGLVRSGTIDRDDALAVSSNPGELAQLFGTAAASA